MPTKRRRHAITETPPVRAALEELRQAVGEDGALLIADLTFDGVWPRGPWCALTSVAPALEDNRGA